MGCTSKASRSPGPAPISPAISMTSSRGWRHVWTRLRSLACVACRGEPSAGRVNESLRQIWIRNGWTACSRSGSMRSPDDMWVIHRPGWSPGTCVGSTKGGVVAVIPHMVRSMSGGELTAVTLGHRVLDDYLEFVAARARPNTLLAAGYDLKVFFEVVAKEPSEVTTADVLDFIKAQRAPRRGSKVVRLEDREPGLSARTIKRRLATVSGLFAYLVARGDADVAGNPVPRGLAARRPGQRGSVGAAVRGVPLIRAPRTLPRILAPAEVDAFVYALRTCRDRAMVEAMVLGGLRRCEVLGLRLGDLQPGERRLFVAEGKGARQRIVSVSSRFFATAAAYFETERPRTSVRDKVFVVLKGDRRGQPLSASGLDEIVDGARHRAGIERLTCHQLRHTCFARLREAGMALEAIQAQAGHASIESTRIYLHLANDWLAGEYLRATEAIDAQAAEL